jgi:hypothetical protein
VSVLDPSQRQFDQFRDALALMIASDFLMEMPPDPLDRIGLGRSLGQPV